MEVGYFQPLGYYQDLLNGAPLFLLKLRYNPKLFNYFLTDVELGFAFSTFTNNNDYSYQMVPIGLAFNYQMPITRSLKISPKLGGGEYILKTTGKSVYNPYAKSGIDFSFQISPNLDLSLGGSFYYLFDQKKSMPGLAGTFSLNYVFGTVLSDKDIKILSLDTQKIFASIYASYYNDPVGLIKLKNTSGGIIKNLKVSLFIKKYMDSPSVFEMKRVIAPNGEFQIPVYAYFNEKIKNLEADTDTTGVLEISYQKADGEKNLKRDIFKTRIYSRNALVWDNLAKLGTFITTKDKKIIEFSRKAMSLKVPGQYRFLPKEIISAVKIIEALRAYQIQYVKDPKSPYDDFGGQRIAVDYVQFPRETLASKSGDCDDLSVLTATLLESVELTTAFVTIPGHIFLMIRLDKPYAKIENTVSYNGKYWLPFEVTALKKGFSSAWLIGYKNYTKHVKEEVLLVENAFKKFRPVLPDNLPQLSIQFNETLLKKNFKQESAQVAKLIQSNPLSDTQIASLSPQQMNKKAIQFALTGNLNRAEKLFFKAIQKDENYRSPYYNLMNLYRIQKKYNRVYEIYNRIQLASPNDKKSILLLSKIEFLRKNYSKAEELQQLALKTGNKNKADTQLLAIIKSAKSTGRASDKYNVTVDWE